MSDQTPALNKAETAFAALCAGMVAKAPPFIAPLSEPQADNLKAAMTELLRAGVWRKLGGTVAPDWCQADLASASATDMSGELFERLLGTGARLHAFPDPPDGYGRGSNFPRYNARQQFYRNFAAFMGALLFEQRRKAGELGLGDLAQEAMRKGPEFYQRFVKEHGMAAIMADIEQRHG